MRVLGCVRGAIAFLPLLLATPISSQAGDPYYSSDTNDLVWFIHVSDSHIGKSWNQSDPLRFALGEAKAIIAPAFVVNTGDLIEGQPGQDVNLVDDWDEYQSITTQMSASPVWYFDVLGNHDLWWMDSWCPGEGGDSTLCDPNSTAGFEMWRSRSVQGPLHPDARFAWSRGNHSFYALNSTGKTRASGNNPGDWMTQNELAPLQGHLAANASRGTRFVFGHHSLRWPSPDDGGINDLEVITALRNGKAYYLHGHDHGFAQSWIGEPSTGIISSKVGSLGKPREEDPSATWDNMAIGVVDHNLFIYRAVDVKNVWTEDNITSAFPLVIITAPASTMLASQRYLGTGTEGMGQAIPVRNPSDPIQYLQNRYSVCRNAWSPIRALVFSAAHTDPYDGSSGYRIWEVYAELETTGTKWTMSRGTDPRVYQASINLGNYVQSGQHILNVKVKEQHYEPFGGPTTTLIRQDSITIDVTDTVPKTCQSEGRVCGQMADGCGSNVQCGTCSSGNVCNAAGQCVCQPKTCAQLPGQCGNLVTCGVVIYCGCDGTCTNNVCYPACTPAPDPCDGQTCGFATDSCGTRVSCGPICRPPPVE